jgi:hypothetical protein
VAALPQTADRLKFLPKSRKCGVSDPLSNTCSV